MRVAVCQVNSRARPGRQSRHRARAARAGRGRRRRPRGAAGVRRLSRPGRGEPKPEPVDGEFATVVRRRRPPPTDVGGRRLLPRGRTGPSAHVQHVARLRPDGALAATYRKIHLFDIDIPGPGHLPGVATVAPGADVVTVDVDGVRVGLSICYDLRFPELYRQLAVAGAQVLLVPAAFTTHTGRDHWEVLLRARAIENQCYVVAAGQIGDHDPGTSCYGRSMVVDPWGTVIAQASDGVGLAVADLDFDRLDRIRQEVPSLANRRLG